MSVKIIMRYYSLFFRALPFTKNFSVKRQHCLNQEKHMLFKEKRMLFKEKRMLFKEKRASTDFDRFY